MKQIRFLVGIALAAACAGSSFAEYNVRQPSADLRPRWSGARAGEWTMDCDAAFAQAKAEGKLTFLLVTGSWWCPHCEAFEEKVILSSAWREMLAERGCYLTMLDFPYRGTVKEAELSKSVHPELGPGWGFNCWLYDEAYLAENGLSVEDGLREIQKRYEMQKNLALPTASQVTIKTWDGTADFTYGKVGYPTLIVFLPDGTEAGRFVPYVTNMEPQEAQDYVLGQLDSIISEALDEQCGLCADTDPNGLTGTATQVYDGWLTDAANSIAGTLQVSAKRATSKGVIRLVARVAANGSKQTFRSTATNGQTSVVFESRSAQLTLVLGVNGLRGSYSTAAGTFAVTGARNVFQAKDEDARDRAQGLEQGVWNVVMRPVQATNLLARGYGGLSIAVKNKGKASVTGTLGDGRKISASGQLIVGQAGVSCLPVSVDTYSGKKGGFGCVFWFKDGWMINVTEIRSWKSVGSSAFDVAWKPIYTALPSYDGSEDEKELVFDVVPTVVTGYPVIEDPDADTVTVSGSTWTGTEISELKVRCAKKTGILSGTMTFFCSGANGKTKRIRARVNGIVSGATGYCSILITGKESWAAKISACDACED